MTKPMHDLKSNFDKVLQTIKSLNLSVPDQNGNIPKPGQVPLFADLEVLSLVLTAGYMSLDSENWLSKKIDSACTIKRKQIYQNPPSNGLELYEGIDPFILRYNYKRRHQGIGRVKPVELYNLGA